jgi:glutaredoxin 3
MLELYGTASCPYTAQLRDDLQWRRQAFVEYDVERDQEALERMLQLCGGERTVPVLADGERVVQVGYEGRGCYARGG